MVSSPTLGFVTLHATTTRPLQERLDEITANTRALVPPERLAGTERLVEQVRASGREETMLSLGATVPPFQLAGANGKVVRSCDLLGVGAVVLKFFRGRWDPYDMTELETWQSLQSDLRHHRTLFISISPQTVRQNAFTVDRHHFTFPLLADPGCQVAEAFGLAYAVPDASQAYLRSILVNVPLMNGDQTWRLPLPATYVIHPEGTVLFAEAHADHRTRPEPQAVLRAVQDAFPVMV